MKKIIDKPYKQECPYLMLVFLLCLICATFIVWIVLLMQQVQELKTQIKMQESQATENNAIEESGGTKAVTQQEAIIAEDVFLEQPKETLKEKNARKEREEKEKELKNKTSDTKEE